MARKVGCGTVFLVCLFITVAALGFWYYKTCYWDYSSSVESAIRKKDFLKAEKIVEKMADVAAGGWNQNCTWEDYKNEYYNLLNARVEYLLSDATEVAVDRLVALFQGLKMGAHPYVGVTSNKDVQGSNERYNTSVSRHHIILDNIISRAIGTRNRYLATAILQCYRPLLIKEKIASHLFSADEYKYSFSYEPGEQAEAKVKAAIAAGKL